MCNDASGLTWVLARTLDGDTDPFFFEEEQAVGIAAAISSTVTGTAAVAAEWFAANAAEPDDPFDTIVAEVCGPRPGPVATAER